MKARAIENNRHSRPEQNNRERLSLSRLHLLYVFALPLALLTLGGCFSSICEDLAMLEETREVVFVGDSLMEIFSTTNCRHVAGNLGLLVGKRIPSLAEGGARLSGGDKTEIPVQFENAKALALEAGTPIRTVFFDGGGNDVLWENDMACLRPDSDACRGIIDTVEQEWVSLVETMWQEPSIENIIYVGSYELQGIWIPYRSAFKELMSRIRERCAEHGVIYVDLEPLFEGHYQELIAMDMLHPNPAGTYVIAVYIQEILAAHGVTL